MRHGWTVFPAVISMLLGLLGFFPPARGGEPLDERLGMPTAPILLLTRADVQSDLKLDPKLVVECQRVAGILQHKASSLKGMRLPGMVAARRAVDEEMSQWLIGHLTPAQLDRLDQLDLQWEGPSAMLRRSLIAEGLTLTSDQREKLTRYLAESKAQRAHRTWTYDDHHDLTRKALAILSEKQRHLWVRILGEPCLFAIGAQTQSTQQPAAGVSSVPPRPGR